MDRNNNNGKYFLQWESQPNHLVRSLCSLVERQTGVDIAICCGNHTLHAHRIILIAGSEYFKEQLCAREGIQQIIVNGVDYVVLRAMIEYLYCGEAYVAEEHMRYFSALARLLKVAQLETILAEEEFQYLAANELEIPPPQFVCKPPKYPTFYKPFTVSPSLPPAPTNNTYHMISPYQAAYKPKKKNIGAEVDRACAKEAHASRVALANLRKIMANSQHMHSLIVEEAFNETTVENFIPASDVASGGPASETVLNVQFPQKVANKPIEEVAGTIADQGLTADKIKHLFGSDNLEIMFQTSDGSYMNVSDEVLLNMSKQGLQYQVVDENGQVGEVQVLQTSSEGLVPNDADKNCGIGGEGGSKVGGDTTANFLSLKKNLDSIPLLPTFAEGMYGNAFSLDTSDIFEPENLSNHNPLMEDDNPLSPYLTRRCNPNRGISITEISENVKDEEETKKPETVERKSSLKFTPDMFFADVPSIQIVEEKSDMDN